MPGGQRRRRREVIEAPGLEIPTNVIELDPIDIAGDPNADVEPFPVVPRKAYQGGDVTPDWVPDWVTSAAGRLRDNAAGVTGWEAPEWMAALLADDEGQMPSSVPEGIARALPLVAPGAGIAEAVRRIGGARGRGQRIAPEGRTVDPLAVASGFSDAASFGFADELAGSALGGDVGEALRSGQRWERRMNPGSAALGDAAATVAQAAIPGFGQGRQMSTAARAGLGAAEGALYGGLEGAGHSTADDLGGRLSDATLPAILSGILGGGMGAAQGRMESRAREPVPTREAEQLRDEAAWHWLSQAGAESSSAKQRMMARGGSEADMNASARRLVEQMRELDILPPEGSYRLPPRTSEIQGRVAEVGEQGDAAIREIQRAMEGVQIDPSTLGQRVRDRAARYAADPSTQSQARTLEQWARGYEGRTPGPVPAGADAVGPAAPVTFRQMQDWKSRLGQAANYEETMRGVRGEVYGDVRDAMQDAVAGARPDLADAYRTARTQSRLGHVVGDAAAADARQAGRNRVTGLTDTMAMLTGVGGGIAGVMANAPTAGIGSAVAGSALMAANRGWRATEHGLRAASLERAARRLASNPERFGRWASILNQAQGRGPRAFAAALYAAQQQDQGVRDALQAQEERDERADTALADVPVVTADSLDAVFDPAEEIPVITPDDLDALFEENAL